MNLLTLRLGSRDRIPPKSPLLLMIVCCTRRFRRYSTMCSRDYVPSLLQFTSIDKSLWITTYTYRSYCHPQLLLLLQDVLKYSSIFREFFMLTALQFLAAWIPLRIITCACRVSVRPKLFMCFTKVFKIIFDLPKILWSLWLLKFLLACIMVNPISLVILMAYLVIIILSLLIQYVANARNPQSDPRIHPSSSDVILNRSRISTSQIAIGSTPKPLDLSILNQSFCLWALNLEIMILCLWALN